MDRNLAILLLQAGRYADAVRCSKCCSRMHDETLGDEHSLTLSVSETLAKPTYELGRFEEAIRLFQEAWP